MTATEVSARRLALAPGEPPELCARLGLLIPPGFAHRPEPIRTEGLLVDGAVHPSLAAGLVATCAPQVGVLIATSVGDVAAALGVRGDLGGSMLRAGGSDVEISAWPADQLGRELARAVPPLGAGPRPALHLPLTELGARADLHEAVVGTLLATVVAPPAVVGQVRWWATLAGWLALEPGEARDGVRWATVRPVDPHDLGAAVAPLAAAAVAS
jgi:hypothetical protein